VTSNRSEALCIEARDTSLINNGTVGSSGMPDDQANDKLGVLQIDNTETTDCASWGIFVKGDRCTTSIGDTLTYWKNAVGDSNVP